MANPTSLTELKRNSQMSSVADDDVSILRKGKIKLDADLDTLNVYTQQRFTSRPKPKPRIPIKIEDCDPAALKLWLFKSVPEPTKYYPTKTFTPPVDVELSDLLNFKSSSKRIPPRPFKCISNSDEQESKLTGANDDSKDHVSDDSEVF